MDSDTPEHEGYHRYHIATRPAPDLIPWPSRFKVRVNRPKLARLLLSELMHYRGDRQVVLSRPCVYGVFSGPVGGFMPREQLCVGCLRCTVQYPDMVEIRPNPARQALGDAYFSSPFVDTVAYEAQSGRVPVKGAGYRGRFGGLGWDGMWTDMSEIVRPTRDGIHGREFISTAVVLGAKPPFLTFDRHGQPSEAPPPAFSIPVPFLFDCPPASAATETVTRILVQAAAAIDSLAVVEMAALTRYDLRGPHIVPLVTAAHRPALEALPFTPRMIEMDGWDHELFLWLQDRLPHTVLCLRTPFAQPPDLLPCYQAGVRTFHLLADYHGQGPGGAFVHDLIRAAHGELVRAGVRDQVTLLGSGGIIAAEHVPKAIIAGLDAVALDTAPLVALQARFDGPCQDRHTCQIHLPPNLPIPWGVQRLQNMAAAWRDQLLEILGAMGLREVRRLRGETGRVMYQVDLEREAFAGIEGYHG